MGESMLQHQSVLLEQSVEALLTDRNGFYVDGTFGRGGHSRRILAQLGDKGRLLVMDKDPAAIAVAQQLAEEDARVSVLHGSFAELQQYAGEHGLKEQIDGVLLDLGVSSPQLDDAERGFSFTKDGPLDMRMNTTEGVSARQWLATADEKEIADVLYRFGEERFSRRMARAIVQARQTGDINSTLQLAEIIKQANPAWEKHKHPATRAFQGIRIFINNELADLQACLEQSLEVLRVGGRLVVISFHSLEDRIVKRFIQKQVKGDDYPSDLPLMQSQLKPRLKSIGKALKVDVEEVSRNVRARSAVMRVAEKTA